MSANLDELRRLRRARDRMDREYAEPLDVPALAHTALMSTAHFSRRFREAYAETPYSYLMTRRIERAKALLRRGDLTGETPSDYRARNHEELRGVSPCHAMVVTRPRRDHTEPVSIGEAPAGPPA
jgi:methylphosphotriester-DNA--protein-cysteine methyltransferase